MQNEVVILPQPPAVLRPRPDPGLRTGENAKEALARTRLALAQCETDKAQGMELWADLRRRLARGRRP